MHWQYRKRSDGKVAVTLDNNVWNFLYDRKMELASELPLDRFVVLITREVEIETLAIPAHPMKMALKDYIAQTIAHCQIRTTSVFGFASGGAGPQRLGGFGQGTWQSHTEAEFYAAIRDQYLIGKPEKNSQLSGNEADAAISAQSFSSIVLTCENPKKTGPLRFAAEHGGQVLFLKGLDLDKMPLCEHIEALYRQI